MKLTDSKEERDYACESAGIHPFCSPLEADINKDSRGDPIGTNCAKKASQFTEWRRRHFLVCYAHQPRWTRLEAKRRLTEVPANITREYFIHTMERIWDPRRCLTNHCVRMPESRPEDAKHMANGVCSTAMVPSGCRKMNIVLSQGTYPEPIKTVRLAERLGGPLDYFEPREMKRAGRCEGCSERLKTLAMLMRWQGSVKEMSPQKRSTFMRLRQEISSWGTNPRLAHLWEWDEYYRFWWVQMLVTMLA